MSQFIENHNCFAFKIQVTSPGDIFIAKQANRSTFNPHCPFSKTNSHKNKENKGQLIVLRSAWVVAGPALAAKRKCEVMAVSVPLPMLTVQLVSLHAVPQHLIGCDKHDTDDESHGEGADQALPDTCLPILLLRMNWKE